MEWVRSETLPDSRFLVVPLADWFADYSSEWFPVLAGRQSIATPQGLEWLPQRTFERRATEHTALKECANSTADCLTTWANITREVFTHIFIPKHAAADCCAVLVHSLATDSRYELVYDQAGATIFARRGSTPNS